MELFEKTFTTIRDIAKFVKEIRGRHRRKLLGTDLRICHDALVEITKRGRIILREMQLLATDELDESSAALFIVLPRLQHRLKMQSFSIMRLNAALARLREALRVLAPEIADRIHEIVSVKESALVELAVTLDRGELPTLLSLRPPETRQLFDEFFEGAAVIRFADIANAEEHGRLRSYLESGTAERHIEELTTISKELRSILVNSFSVEELLDATGPLRFRDPDALAGGDF